MPATELIIAWKISHQVLSRQHIPAYRYTNKKILFHMECINSSTEAEIRIVHKPLNQAIVTMLRN
jgi:hypothetical protein